MFQYQVDDMRRSVAELLKQPIPPEDVLIKLVHAEHLGLGYRFVEAVNEVKSSGIQHGLAYGSVVRVSLQSLFMKLKEARGIDADDYESTRGQRASADAGR